MSYFLTFLFSYLLGSLNPARITAKRVKGIDITKVNSKNPGTSNIALTLGMKYAVLVGFLDIFKGFLPVLVARLVFEDLDIYWFIAGFSAVLGHAFPIYSKFKGGKGTASFGGAVIGISPIFSILMAALFFITLFTTKYVAVATLAVIVTIPLTYIFYYDFHFVSLIIVSLYAFVSFCLHLPNFIKILKKEELKLDAVKKDNK